MEKVALWLLLAAAVGGDPCSVCRPDERMAVLAGAGADSFDRLAAPGRTLLRAMAVDPLGAPLPVVTLTRDGSRAIVEAALGPGRRFVKPISLEVFSRAEDEARRLKAVPGRPACSGRSVSVQIRFGEGPMSAIANRGCDKKIGQVAEDFAALAARAEPGSSRIGGNDAFERLRHILTPLGHPATTMGPNKIQ